MAEKLKRINSILILMILLTLILNLSGCSNRDNGKDYGEVLFSEKDMALKEVNTFLDGKPGAASISTFIRTTELTLSGQTGDLLLERLILTQLDTIEKMKQRLFQDEYLTALNDTMGGILDGTKIKDIANETVRQDYQEIFDSFLKIVRYEETPVIEPDWSALTAYSNFFSNQLSAMIGLRDKQQNRYYVGEPLNFDLLAEDIVLTEQLIRNTKNKFVSWQLNQLYDRQIGNLLLGPEGSFLEGFAMGQETEVARIRAYAEKYSDNDLGNLCSHMINSEQKDLMSMTDLIIYKSYFDVDDSREIARIRKTFDGINYSLIEISGLEDQETANKINQAIRMTAEALGQTDMPEQTVSAAANFANDNFMSIDVMSSYADSSGKFQFHEKYLTFDLVTGEQLNLDGLFGSSFEDYQEQLIIILASQKPDVKLDQPPEFLLIDQGMWLMTQGRNTDESEYYHLTLNEIRNIMDISLLY